MRFFGLRVGRGGGGGVALGARLVARLGGRVERMVGERERLDGEERTLEGAELDQVHALLAVLATRMEEIAGADPLVARLVGPMPQGSEGGWTERERCDAWAQGLFGGRLADGRFLHLPAGELRALPRSAWAPAVTDLAIGEDGELWVRREAHSASQVAAARRWEEADPDDPAPRISVDRWGPDLGLLDAARMAAALDEVLARIEQRVASRAATVSARRGALAERSGRRLARATRG